MLLTDSPWGAFVFLVEKPHSTTVDWFVIGKHLTKRLSKASSLSRVWICCLTKQARWCKVFHKD